MNSLDTVTMKVIALPEKRHVESIVIDTFHKVDKPCIIMLHGGPHNASTIAFNPMVAAFALEGCERTCFDHILCHTNSCLDTVVLPNYTGSIGYGQRYVKDLIGNCGDIDVKDCFAMASHLVLERLALPEKGIYVFGGSHGGFLAGNCTLFLTFILSSELTVLFSNWKIPQYFLRGGAQKSSHRGRRHADCNRHP